MCNYWHRLGNSRNPYFIGINSAIAKTEKEEAYYKGRNPYFIGINSAIFAIFNIWIEEDGSQSLFYWN